MMDGFYGLDQDDEWLGKVRLGLLEKASITGYVE